MHREAWLGLASVLNELMECTDFLLSQFLVMACPASRQMTKEIPNYIALVWLGLAGTRQEGSWSEAENFSDSVSWWALGKIRPLDHFIQCWDVSPPKQCIPVCSNGLPGGHTTDHWMVKNRFLCCYLRLCSQQWFRQFFFSVISKVTTTSTVIWIGRFDSCFSNLHFGAEIQTAPHFKINS